jgi:hypothetical protein
MVNEITYKYVGYKRTSRIVKLGLKLDTYSNNDWSAEQNNFVMSYMQGMTLPYVGSWRPTGR